MNTTCEGFTSQGKTYSSNRHSGLHYLKVYKDHSRLMRDPIYIMHAHA